MHTQQGVKAGSNKFSTIQPNGPRRSSFGAPCTPQEVGERLSQRNGGSALGPIRPPQTFLNLIDPKNGRPKRPSAGGSGVKGKKFKRHQSIHSELREQEA